MKRTAQFKFTYQMVKQVVRNTRIEIDTLPLEISGFGYWRDGSCSVDIDDVIYEGTNIKEVLVHLDAIEEIEVAAQKVATKFFTDKLAA